MSYPDPSPLQRLAITDVRFVVGEVGTFVRYVVLVELVGREWTLQRRYSEFLDLHGRLSARYPTIMSRFEFPPKELFSATQDVVLRRRRQLQDFLRSVANISVPLPGGGGLVRLRELDDFLEVPQRLFADEHNLPTRPVERSEGDVRRRARTSSSAGGGGSRWLRSNLASEASVSPMNPALDSFGGGASKKQQSLREAERDVEQLLETVTRPGCGSTESRTVEAFVEDFHSGSEQDPLERLDRVREFVEDLGVWIANHRASHLEPLVRRVLRLKDAEKRSGANSLAGTSWSSKHSNSGGASSDLDGVRRRSAMGDSMLRSFGGGEESTRSPRSPVEATDRRGTAVDEDDDVEEKRVDAVTAAMRAAARRSVQRAVIPPLLADLLYAARQSAGAADALIVSRLAALRAVHGNIPPEAFGAPSRLRVPRSSLWEEALASVMTLEQQPLPYLQAQSLLRIVRTILAAAREEEELRSSPAKKPSKAKKEEEEMSTLAADDFLPLFLWTVARAYPQRLATAHAFLKSLTPTPEMRGELEYFLTTLESTVVFLSRLEVSDASTESSSIPLVRADLRRHSLTDPPRNRSRTRSTGAPEGLRLSEASALAEDVAFGVVPATREVMMDAEPAPRRPHEMDVGPPSFDAGNRTARVGVEAVVHPLFRSVTPLDAARWLSLAVDTVFDKDDADAVATAARAMCEEGPSAGWMWILIPAAINGPPLPPPNPPPPSKDPHRYVRVAFCPTKTNTLPFHTSRILHDVGTALICARKPAAYFFQCLPGEGSFAWSLRSPERARPVSTALAELERAVPSPTARFPDPDASFCFWEGPYPTLEACVMWCQAYYEQERPDRDVDEDKEKDDSFLEEDDKEKEGNFVVGGDKEKDGNFVVGGDKEKDGNFVEEDDKKKDGNFVEEDDKEKDGNFVEVDDESSATKDEEKTENLVKEVDEETTTKDDEEETTTKDDLEETTTKDVDEETTEKDDHEETTTKDDEEETTTKDDEEETTTKDDQEETSTKDDHEETTTKDDEEETTTKDDHEETTTKDDEEETTKKEDTSKKSSNKKSKKKKRRK